MKTQDLILTILQDHGILTANEVSCFAMLDHKEKVSPQSVSGYMRTLGAKCKVGCSSNGSNKKVYWLIRETM